MTITASDVTPTSALDSEYRHLALLASQGDGAAGKKLMVLEVKIDDLARAERRKVAAEAEGQRVAEVAQEAASQVERQGKLERHSHFVGQRLDAFKEIEKATAALAREVELALAVDQEIWALALQLEWPVERRTSARIENFILSALGREGAGLKSLSMVPAGLREPLVPQE
jgi:hypothetical protein